MTLTEQQRQLPPPPVHPPEAGVIEEARARQRRHRRRARIAVIAAAAIIAILLAFSGGGRSHLVGASGSRGGSPSPVVRGSLASCVSPKAKALQRAPSRALLATLGVLRRPASAADALPPRFARRLLAGGATRAVFVRYVRRARVIAGSSYYVYPAIVGGCDLGKAHEGVMELVTHVDLGHGIYGGSGGGGDTAAQIKRRGGMFGSQGSSRHATVTGVVPDGVATVTLYYPAGPSSGFSHKVLPAVAIKVRVVNNLWVANVPRGASNALRWTKVIWRAADSKILKAIPGQRE